MPITDLQIQRFQKYFQVIEEIHTIELGAVNFTDEKLQNFLNGTTNWNTTFAKTSRGWYRCKQRQSYGFTIAFSNKSIRELKTADQLNEFIQNDMEYELLKGYFNHYIKYFELDTTVDKESENLGFLRSITLFSFFIDEDSRKYSRKKLLKEVEQELTAFENSINSFEN